MSSPLLGRGSFNEAGCTTIVDPSTTISDHSLLVWSVRLEGSVQVDINTGPDVAFEKYDLQSVPPDFMNDANARQRLQECMERLNTGDAAVDSLDDVYSGFCELVHSEMNSKLVHKTVVIKSGLSNKRRRFKKPWWTTQLTEKWNSLCDAETEWSRTVGQQRTRANELRKLRQKDFDRACQSAKRRHWRAQQEELLSLQSGDTGLFWKTIGKIGVGQNRRQQIPMEVVNDAGEVTRDPEEVLDRWKCDFEQLLNPARAADPPPQTTPDAVERDVESLNGHIERSEVVRALRLAKNGKAQGEDCIPVEVLRNQHAIDVLCRLFNVCFQTGQIPAMWQKGIINPIPKCSTSDARVPLNYRGITLASCVYKVYCSVLNQRLSEWAEGCELLIDNQNGFRKKRSTIDHLSTLTMVIETRKQQRKSTYVAFVDFSKAYDRIDRQLLWEKLRTLGVSGPFLGAVQSLYKDVKCCVRLNGKKTSWFDVTCGLKQGCLLSPLLFNMFVNDLAVDIENMGLGVPVGHDRLGVLLYADDLDLIAESEAELQQMLDMLGVWCSRWRMKVNTDKTKVVHFRPGPATPRSTYDFNCGGTGIDCVDRYRYLGLVLTEFLDYIR